MTTTVVVVGATGNLGCTIVAKLVQRGAQVRALVRPGNADGAARLRTLGDGGRLQLVTGDLHDATDVLTGHLRGADVVVSAVQGGPEVVVDGRQPVDLTSIDDTAAYTAAAALDGSAAGRSVRVAGQTLTMRELHREAERGTGRSLVEQPLGSVEDLAQEIERRKATADDPYEYVAVQYQWAMVTGKGKLEPLDNHRYPDIVPTTVAQFLAAQRGAS